MDHKVSLNQKLGHKMFHISLLNLPNELLLQIFDCLSAQELLCLKGTNKRIHDLIVTSAALYNRFWLTIDGYKCDKMGLQDLENLIHGGRKFERIRIFNLKAQRFEIDDYKICLSLIIEIIRTLGGNIKFFEMTENGITLENLLKIFEMIPNVETISLKRNREGIFYSYHSYHYDVETAPRPNMLPKFKKLVDLTLHYNDETYDLPVVFQNATHLETFMFDGKNTDILKNLNCLKKLQILENRYDSTQFFRADIQNQLKFRLNSFTYKSDLNYSDIKWKENIPIFLQQQVHITDLRFEVSNTSDSINYFLNLKKLKILKLKELSLDSSIFKDLKFVEVANLELVELYLVREYLKIVLFKTFSKCWVLHINIKRELDLENQTQFWKDFSKNNPSIREVVLDGIVSTSLIFSIANGFKQLEALAINFSKYCVHDDYQIIHVISKSFKSLKKFQIMSRSYD